MRSVKVGVIGAGFMGKIRAAIFSRLRNCELVGIADIDRTRANRLARRFNTKSFTSYQHLLAEEKIDAVTVSVPHALHRSIVTEAARAGKHVLCEKPLAPTVEEIDKMIKAAETNKVKLMVGATHRYWIQNVKAKELLQKGVIGNLVMINDYILTRGFGKGFPSWFGKKELAGGGVFLDNGSHSVDRILWWTASQPESVYARMGTLGNKVDVEDNGAMILNFKNNLIATVELSYSVPEKATTCAARLIGTKGVIELHTWKSIRYITHKTNRWIELKIPASTPHGYETETKEFIDYITKDKESRVSLRDARKVVEIINAAYLSSRLNKVIRF